MEGLMTMVVGEPGFGVGAVLAGAGGAVFGADCALGDFGGTASAAGVIFGVGAGVLGISEYFSLKSEIMFCVSESLATI